MVVLDPERGIGEDDESDCFVRRLGTRTDRLDFLARRCCIEVTISK
jgi:hypothetical protein